MSLSQQKKRFYILAIPEIWLRKAKQYLPCIIFSIIFRIFWLEKTCIFNLGFSLFSWFQNPSEGIVTVLSSIKLLMFTWSTFEIKSFILYFNKMLEIYTHFCCESTYSANLKKKNILELKIDFQICLRNV